MKYQKNYKIGPNKTPLILKFILITMLLLSFISSFLAPFLKTNYIPYFFGLSLQGIKSFFLWQFFSYNFLEYGSGINFSYLFHLLFNTYLIWITASFVIEMTSKFQFLLFYFLSTIFSGLVMLLVMALGYQNMIFANSNIGLYSCLIAWMMLNAKNTKIYLFFAIGIKHYWLVLGLIGFNLFTNLTNFQMVPFFGYLTATIFSYFFSVIVWKKFGPFEHLNNFERSLMYLFRSKR